MGNGDKVEQLSKRGRQGREGPFGESSGLCFCWRRGKKSFDLSVPLRRFSARFKCQWNQIEERNRAGIFVSCGRCWIRESVFGTFLSQFSCVFPSFVPVLLRGGRRD